MHQFHFLLDSMHYSLNFSRVRVDIVVLYSAVPKKGPNPGGEKSSGGMQKLMDSVTLHREL